MQMIKKLLLVTIVIVTVYILFTLTPLKTFELSTFKAFILSYGPLAPILFIILFTLVPLTLFPDAALAIAGGAIFGVWWGTLYIIIGALMGASLAFFISRFLGRKSVEKLMRHQATDFEEGVEKSGFVLILLLRLIPLIPFDVISYAAGLSKIRYADFMAGTLIGIIPGVIIYANIGDKALDVHSPEFYLAMALLVVLMAVSYLLKKRFSFKKIQNSFSKEF